MTCFRIGIATCRIAEILNEHLGKNDKVSGFFVIETGNQTTYSGEGIMLDEFKKSGGIENYSGLGVAPKRIYDREFNEALCRSVTFSKTYYKLNYDARNSN